MSIFSNLLKKQEEIKHKRNELNTEIKELDNQIEKEFEVIENKIRNVLKENYYYYNPEHENYEEEYDGVLKEDYYYYNPEHENYEEEYDGETYDNLRIEHSYKSIYIRMAWINPKVIKQLEEEIGMKCLGVRWSDYFKSKIVVAFLIE